MTLLAYCKLIGTDSWALVFDKFIDGDYFLRNLIEDLTFATHHHHVDSVREENKRLKYTNNGKLEKIH